MSHPTFINKFERNAAILASNDNNIYDFYITYNGSIIRVNSKEALLVETFSDLRTFFTITTQGNNLSNLLNRVRALNPEESNYDQDTKNRLCDYVMRKFQSTLEKQKDLLERKEHELACLRKEVSDLLDSVLPQPSTTRAPLHRSNNNVVRELDLAFDSLENMAKKIIQEDNRSADSCSMAARRRRY